MGTISSGVGLISGLDIEDIVTKLMAIESKPRDQLETRIEKNSNKQAALMRIQARVMALQLAAANFNKEAVFKQKTGTSSNEDVLKVTATQFSTVGDYRFIVKRLATNHHFISKSYSSINSTILNSGVSAGTLSFEIGQGQLARATSLSFINGQQGIVRGTLAITDSTGGTAEIDLSTALTVQDVLDAINKSSQIKVTASVSGDHLVLTDNAGGTGQLQVGASETATSLGLDALAQTGASYSGSDIMYVTADTRLADLNDGNGVRDINSSVLDDLKFTLGDGTTVMNVGLSEKLFEVSGDSSQSSTLQSLNGGAGVRTGTFRITDRNGKFADINLADLGSDATLAQLREKIEQETEAKGMDIAVTFHGLDHLSLVDNSQADTSGTSQRTSNFIIEDLDGGSAAADLGIVKSVAGSTITGEQVWRMETLGDVINAVNNHWSNDGQLVLAINEAGTGLKAIDNSGGGGDLVIESAYSSMAGEDLGLITSGGNGGVHEGRRLIAGLNTTMLRSLNGGSGTGNLTAGGVISLTDRDGNTATLDGLADAFTVQDVLDAINDTSVNTTNIRARINAAGNGIILEDSSSGSGNMIVSDISGNLAEQLQITVNDAVSKIDSGNLQLQYVSEATLLSELRQGAGVTRGNFTITDGLNRKATINLLSDSIATLGDVIDEINKNTTGVRARLNDTGDGILLYDTSEGEGLPALKVAEAGGTTASELGLLSQAKQDEAGKYYIDGSYELKLEVTGADTIQDIVDKINASNIQMNAALIYDGASYRISFNSEISGSKGNVYLDAGQTNLTTQTISKGKDALVLLGGDEEGANPFLISSSSNTLKNVIKGTTLELVRANDSPVNVSITQDLDGIIAQMKSFVEAYNSIMGDLDDATSFNTETYEKGILFADSTVSNIRSILQGMVQRVVPGVKSSINRLSKVGISYAALGSETKVDEQGKNKTYIVASTPKLQFDEEKFRQAIAQDPEAVASLFTQADTGIGDYIGDRLERLAGSSGSTIKSRLDSMQSQQDMFQDRIDYLDEMLSRKEERLYNQFYAMEEALSTLQTQQTALSSLSNLIKSS